MTGSLERAVRVFVAEGSGLPHGWVIPGNSKGVRRKEPYASLLLIDDIRLGYPIRRQLPGGQTADLTYRRATYSLQFYREGAVEMARRFDAWAMSENGLTQAETAFADGRIDRARVLRGGTGFGEEVADPVVMDDPGCPGLGGQLRLTTVRGAVAGAAVARRGQNYVNPPVVTVPSPTGRDEDAAKISLRGYGFRVVFPLRLTRLDAIEADQFEERVGIDLGIDYASWDIQDTGEIDEVECTLAAGDTAIVGTVRIGGGA